MNYTLIYSFDYETENDCFHYDDYEYHPSEDEVNDAWEQFVNELEEPLESFDSVEEAREYYENPFIDFLTEWCRDAARDAFYNDPDIHDWVQEYTEFRGDLYAYYGVSRSDFC